MYSAGGEGRGGGGLTVVFLLLLLLKVKSVQPRCKIYNPGNHAPCRDDKLNPGYSQRPIVIPVMNIPGTLITRALNNPSPPPLYELPLRA